VRRLLLAAIALVAGLGFLALRETGWPHTAGPRGHGEAEQGGGDAAAGAEKEAPPEQPVEEPVLGGEAYYLPRTSPYWDRDYTGCLGGHWAGIVTVLARNDEGTWSLSVGDLEPTDPARLAGTLRKCREAVEARGLVPLGQVVSDAGVQEALVAEVLHAFHEAGIHDVEIGWPPLEGYGLDGEPCACHYGWPGITVPVAAMAEWDKDNDPDDRVTVHLQATGALRGTDGEPVTLYGLAEQLKAAAERYDAKMKERGQRGFEESSPGVPWSKLYVLVRADAAAPWEHVEWILHVLAESRFYKVQLAARRPDLPTGPCAPFALTGKLSTFLPTTTPPAIVGPLPGDVRPRVEVLADGRYYCGGLATRDPAELTPYMRKVRLDAAEEARVVVEVVAAPGVTVQQVVSAVDALAAAGLEKVDFAGVPAPSPEIRRCEVLPR